MTKAYRVLDTAEVSATTSSRRFAQDVLLGLSEAKAIDFALAQQQQQQQQGVAAKAPDALAVAAVKHEKGVDK